MRMSGRAEVGRGVCRFEDPYSSVYDRNSCS